MAPVVFLPNLLSNEKPFSLNIAKSSARGTEAVSDLAKQTPVVSPSPQHAVKTPVVLWPQTPEPSDPDFAFFFPMQELQEPHSMMGLPTVPSTQECGQNTEASYNSSRTAGLPLQVLDNAFRDMEGDELCFWASADSNFISNDAEYEEEQPFEFAPLMSDDKPPAIDVSLENKPVALSDKEFLHQSGQCRPCAWFYKKPGCQNGANCGYCHLCPEGELKARKKSKVLLLKSGALEPRKEGTGPGAGRQLRLDPLVGSMESSGTSNLHQ